MLPVEKQGRIFTFYSFKGGVGRTMALANLAYLAAHNGMKVLMMDWDLEAPGLAYYFRGLLESSAARQLKDTPGILDLVWDWKTSIKQTENPSELGSLVDSLKNGERFQTCVRSIVDPEFIPEEARIDFIGAGQSEIKTPTPISYEEALARFSWSSFFEDDLGGVWVDALRKWASSNYDLILIDSRTGLADVSGICTMQLPDEVALCFVLNRQNIDGIAKVSAAIRSKRAEEVKVRALPMRVARLNTPEETDARARAIADLTRVGGFSSDGATRDLSLLAIPAADNVPFYETLAHFTAEDPLSDVLTISYKKMAAALLGREISEPALNEDLVAIVRRRLLPRHATVEYVSKLQSAEPNRAIEELSRLIESAYESSMDDDEYVDSLVNAAFVIDDATYVLESLDLQNHALELVRAMAASKPERWRSVLVSTIERYVARLRLNSLDDDDEMTLLEELDALLSESPTISAKLQRISHRRRAAWLAFNNSNDSASQIAGEVNSLANELGRDSSYLSPEQLEEVVMAEIDMGFLLGEIYSENAQKDLARREYSKALGRFFSLESATPKPEFRRLGAELHTRLALFPLDSSDLNTPVEHALQAVQLNNTSVGFVLRLPRIIPLVIQVAPDSPELILSFCEALLNESNERSSRPLIANYYGRQPRMAIMLLPVFINLIQTIGRLDSPRATEIVVLLSSTLEQLLKALLRRRQIINEKARAELLTLSDLALNALLEAGAPAMIVDSIEDTIKTLKVGMTRPVKRLNGGAL